MDRMKWEVAVEAGLVIEAGKKKARRRREGEANDARRMPERGESMRERSKRDVRECD